MSRTFRWNTDTYITEDALVSMVGQHAPVRMGDDRVGTAEVVSASVEDEVLIMEISVSRSGPAMPHEHTFTDDHDDALCTVCLLNRSQWRALFSAPAPAITGP